MERSQALGSQDLQIETADTQKARCLSAARFLSLAGYLAGLLAGLPSHRGA